MTLVIGTKENAHFAQKAFSLIEIVLVLALIALATSAVILNFDSFMGKDASPLHVNHFPKPYATLAQAAKKQRSNGALFRSRARCFGCRPLVQYA